MRTAAEDREAISVERVSKRFLPTPRTQFTPPVPLVSRLFKRHEPLGPSSEERDDDDGPDETGGLEDDPLPPVPDRVIWALRGVSFAVRPGATLAIVGSPAAGKTTLLRVLSGVSTPTCGRAVLRGSVFPVADLATAVMRADVAPATNVLKLAQITGGSRRLARRRLSTILRFAGAEDLGLGMEYPRGLLRRMATATALYLDHDIVLLDDLGQLDSDFRDACADRVSERAAEGHTAVLASRDLDLLERVCTDALWLERGEVRQVGDAAAVLSGYRANIQRRKRDAALASSGPPPTESTQSETAQVRLPVAGQSETAQIRLPLGGQSAAARLPVAGRSFNKLAALIAARVVDSQGHEVTIVRNDESFDVELGLEIGGYPVRLLSLVGFAGEEGQMHAAVMEPDYVAYDRAGRYTVTARVSAGALPAGNYGLRVNVVVSQGDVVLGAIGRSDVTRVEILAVEEERSGLKPVDEKIVEFDDDTLWAIRPATWAIRYAGT
jgi:ABC-type polysaccharide/polyol phosphate transport system ATPase subunit